MAFARTNLAMASTTSGASKVLTVSGLSAGQLLIVNVGINVASTTFTCTDNGLGGWTKIFASNETGGQSGWSQNMFYKVVSTAEITGGASPLTSVTVGWSGTPSAGSCGVDQITGFLGTPTLDLSGAGGTGTGTATSVAAQDVASQHQANEFAYSAICYAIVGTDAAECDERFRYYTPDAATTKYQFTTAQLTGAHITIGYSSPTTNGTHAEWGWTFTATTCTVLGATFYDASTTVSGAGGIAATFTAGATDVTVVPAVGGISASFVASATDLVKVPAGGSIAASFSAGATATTIVPGAGGISGAFAASAAPATVVPTTGAVQATFSANGTGIVDVPASAAVSATFSGGATGTVDAPTTGAIAATFSAHQAPARCACPGHRQRPGNFQCRDDRRDRCSNGRRASKRRSRLDQTTGSSPSRPAEP